METGNTQWRRGDTLSAVDTWQAIRAYAESNNDVFLGAAIASNLGFAYLRLDRLAQAGSEFHRAFTGLIQLGKEAAAVRPRWGLAALLVKSGDARRGAESLRKCLHECEERGMTEERMLISLDLADALLLLGETTDASRLCKSLVRSFNRAGLRNSALRAFDFLRQAALNEALTREKIGYVRLFIERLIANPALRFAPPSP
jgi:tetratricopeptide (TPR) repeat protein